MPFSLYLRPRLSDRSEETFLRGHPHNSSRIISLHYWKAKGRRGDAYQREGK